MTDEEYFAHPAISNSKLGLINRKQGGSPLKYILGFDEKDSYRKALETGTNIHLAILEPKRYVVSDTMKPSGKIAPVVERIFHHRDKGLSILDSIEKACQEVNYGQSYKPETRLKNVIEGGLLYYVFLRTKDNKVCMAADVYESVTKAVNSIQANAEAMYCLNPPERDVFNENAYFQTVTVTITNPMLGLDTDVELMLKCKIDNWSIDRVNKIVTLNDLKSTSSPIDLFDGYLEEFPHPRYIMGSFQKWRYYRQMAMYLDILRHNVEKMVGLGFTFEVNMIVVETRHPYQSRVFKVCDQTLEYGRKEYKELLKDAAYVSLFGADVQNTQVI